MAEAPVLLWLRRDLRLDDHPALAAALRTGERVLPVFIHDESTETLGAAPRFRLGLSLGALAAALEARGSRLVLRRGRAEEVLAALVAETGAGAVFWSRLYDPASTARDSAVKAALRAAGVRAESFAGHLLAEPWEIGGDGGYKVFGAFWKALRRRGVGAPEPVPGDLRPPARWPSSDRLEDWALGAAMNRGAGVVARHQAPGAEGAEARLAHFLEGPVGDYAAGRDMVEADATSGLSENLAWGEISPRRIWHRAAEARGRSSTAGAEAFLRQLGWRDFAWHLLYHAPHMAERNWRAEWDAFPWRGDSADAEAWRRGMTGEPFVDAAMREMFVSGTMHNRARMIVASYLTKHLLTDWRVGLDWFAECLTDWDPAANALNWQWVAGSGPDAAPYFRVFNPALQARKFDGSGAYRRRWIAEAQADPPETALDFFAAAPRSWALDPAQDYPAPRIGLAEGRARALAAYERRRT